MGRQEDVVEFAQGIVWRCRFLFKDVDDCAANLFVFECGYECLFVDDWSAAAIGDDGVGLHAGECVGIDEVMRAVEEGHVEADVVRGREEGVQFHVAHIQAVFFFCRCGKFVGVDDVHSEAERADFRKATAYATKADNAQGFAE